MVIQVTAQTLKALISDYSILQLLRSGVGVQVLTNLVAAPFKS